MYKCSACGKATENSYVGMCQACWRYFKDGGQVHPLPEHGKIEYDDEGKVICHICGRSYKRLGSHARESHSMTIEEYKAEFGLNRRARTTEQNYSLTMRELALEYGMDERLREIGKNTRIKPGEKDKRKGKEVRLQEIINKKNRKIKKTEKPSI